MSSIENALLARAERCDGIEIKENYIDIAHKCHVAIENILGKGTNYYENPERCIYECLLTREILLQGGL